MFKKHYNPAHTTIPCKIAEQAPWYLLYIKHCFHTARKAGGNHKADKVRNLKSMHVKTTWTLSAHKSVTMKIKLRNSECTIETEPGIYRDEERNLADPEEVQHCLRDCLKGHLETQPTKCEENKRKIFWMKPERITIIYQQESYLHRVESWRNKTFSNFGHKFVKQTWCITLQIWYWCH